MNRVISNKGSRGVDGMSVYELKQFLKTHWLQINRVHYFILTSLVKF